MDGTAPTNPPYGAAQFNQMLRSTSLVLVELTHVNVLAQPGNKAVGELIPKLRCSLRLNYLCSMRFVCLLHLHLCWLSVGFYEE